MITDPHGPTRGCGCPHIACRAPPSPRERGAHNRTSRDGSPHRALIPWEQIINQTSRLHSLAVKEADLRTDDLLGSALSPFRADLFGSPQCADVHSPACRTFVRSTGEQRAGERGPALRRRGVPTSGERTAASNGGPDPRIGFSFQKNAARRCGPAESGVPHTRRPSGVRMAILHVPGLPFSCRCGTPVSGSQSRQRRSALRPPGVRSSGAGRHSGVRKWLPRAAFSAPVVRGPAPWGPVCGPPQPRAS